MNVKNRSKYSIHHNNPLLFFCVVNTCCCSFTWYWADRTVHRHCKYQCMAILCNFQAFASSYEFKDGLWGRYVFSSCITTFIAQSSPFSWRCVNASISLMCLLGTLFSIYGAYRILKKWCGKCCSDGSDRTDIESGGLKMANKKADLWLPSIGEWNSHEEPEMIMDCGSCIHGLILSLAFHAYYVPYIFTFPAFQWVWELLELYYHRVTHPG